jgi:hypothetical protein
MRRQDGVRPFVFKLDAFDGCTRYLAANSDKWGVYRSWTVAPW